MSVNDKHREEIEDAIIKALESGWTKEDVRAEVEYAIEVFDEPL